MVGDNTGELLTCTCLTLESLLPEPLGTIDAVLVALAIHWLELLLDGGGRFLDSTSSHGLYDLSVNIMYGPCLHSYLSHLAMRQILVLAVARHGEWLALPRQQLDGVGRVPGAIHEDCKSIVPVVELVLLLRRIRL